MDSPPIAFPTGSPSHEHVRTLLLDHLHLLRLAAQQRDDASLAHACLTFEQSIRQMKPWQTTAENAPGSQKNLTLRHS